MKLMLKYVVVSFTGVILGISLAMSSGVMAEKQPLPIKELREFTDVFSRIKTDYVEEVDDRTLLNFAIRGMLSGLDPHSSYLDKEDFKDLQIGTSGEFGGLGIEVGMENGFIKVISPIDDTPAKKAGILAGDLIIRINDESLKDINLNDAVDKMRGKPNTDIKLTLLREGEDKPLEITITRAIIKVKSVRSKLLHDHYGYVRISQFQAHTGEQMFKAIKKLIKQSKDSLYGMILDLRNNPGGVLTASIEVSDAFLNKGLIVYTEGRIDDSILKFSAKKGDILNGKPLVVLVNAGSASASEIVAGALQDHKRAIIMGKTTFGKGSVQSILPLTKTTALKLTTARYFTPSGKSIQAEGIKPDIELDDISLKHVETNTLLKEVNLSRHLDKGDKSSNNQKNKKTLSAKKDNKAQEDKEIKDYALHEAIMLLKGLSIYSASK